MNTFDLALDLDKRAGVTQWVTLRQGDHNGTVLKATIYDHGVQVGGGYTCRVSIRIAGSGDEYYRETANYSNGVATVTIDEQYAAAVVGITYGYFELLQGSAVIASTESFGVRVLQSAQEGAVPGDKYDSAIEDALAELDEATGRISQMVVDATEEYLEAHPEITTTVQDNSLTDAKLVQRGGILSREQWLETMLPNIPRKATSESDVHSVSDSAGGGPLGISVYGRSTQDGTPTPDAPVAIESVGPDSEGNISLWARGFNQWDEEWEVGAISVTSGIDTSGQNIRSKNYIPILPNTTYYFKINMSVVKYNPVNFYDVDKNFIGSITQQVQNATFTTPSNARYMRFYVNSDYGTVYKNDICINLSDPARNGTYAPYTGTVITIDLDGHALRSLPDGTRDEVTVDEWGHAILTQRVGSYTVTGSETPTGSVQYVDYRRVVVANCMPEGMDSTPTWGATNKGLCSHAPFVFDQTGQSTHVYVAGRTLALFYPTTVSADVVTAFAGATLIYPLATPQTIDLGYLDPALLPAPDLTAYVVPSAPSVLRYGFDVAAAIAEIATA